MNCPKCGNQQADGNAICSGCGIVFEKYYKYNPPAEPDNQHGGHNHVIVENNYDVQARPVDVSDLNIKQRLLLIGSDEDIIYVSARGLVLTGMLVLSFLLITSKISSNYVGEIFLHNVNLVFHEAGHFVFRPFGQFIRTLGGSLGQLLMPAICFYTFLFRKTNPFAAAVCFWWTGENFLDMAPYINDASSGELPLLGGNYGYSAPYGFHDWEYLLTESGLITHDHVIAGLSFFSGSVMMVLALIWGGTLLYRQFKVALHK